MTRQELTNLSQKQKSSSDEDKDRKKSYSIIIQCHIKPKRWLLAKKYSGFADLQGFTGFLNMF